MKNPIAAMQADISATFRKWSMLEGLLFSSKK
jgi:hypothetical protein